MATNTDIELGTVSDHRISITDNESDVDTHTANSASPSHSTTSCYLSDDDVVDDLECGGADVDGVKESVKVGERDCRICHLSIVVNGSDPEYGFGIELGCACKGDLSAAHKLCADTWFKIRGNKTCEICGSVARNVVGVNDVEPMEPWNEANDAAPTGTAAVPPPRLAETRHFWQGHKFLNFLLACMVFAFVISWLFHFNVPS